MAVWGKILGAAAGLAMGGPLGALVGGIAGHFIKGRVADNHMRVAFLALLMAMGGTLLIDGVAL